MWEEWGNKIAADSGFNTGNIYQNYANAGVVNASPEATFGKEMAVKADVDERARKEAEAAAAAAADIEAKKEALKKDPGKAYMKLGEDGRYHFYNGAGEGMNINQFSLLTGKRPDELLADSENPYDQKFVSDYQTMRMFASAWVNGDNDTLKRFRESDPQKFNELISNYKSPAEMIAGFRQHYSDYYGDTYESLQQANSPRVTSPSMSPKFDFSPDKKDTAGQNISKLLAGSDLGMTLTPDQYGEAPKDPGYWNNLGFGISQWGPLALVGGGTMWGKSNAQQSYDKYQEDKKKNPWTAYNAYLGR